MRRQLKNYAEYLFRLRLFAKSIRIKLEFKTDPCSGHFIPTQRKVVIDPDMAESETIATILHELGHFIDDSSLDKRTHKILNDSYSVIYTDFYTTKDVSRVHATEIRAWNYGLAIAKNLGIPVGLWYAKIANEAIRNYKKLEKAAIK